MKLVDLFSVPIYVGKVEHHNTIKQTVLSNIDDNGTPSNWDCSVNSSFETNQSWLNKLTDLYSKNYEEYFQCFGISAKLNLIDAWYNEYKESQYQEKHHHLPADISCIHYIKLDPHDNGTTFVNPLNLLNASNRLLTRRSPHTFTPYVEEGDMIIFPSYLEHFVKPHGSCSQRVTLSWNYNLSEIYDLNLGEGA